MHSDPTNRDWATVPDQALNAEQVAGEPTRPTGPPPVEDLPPAPVEDTPPTPVRDTPPSPVRNPGSTAPVREPGGGNPDRGLPDHDNPGPGPDVWIEDPVKPDNDIVAMSRGGA